MRLRVDAAVLADSLGWIMPCVPRVPAVPLQAGIYLDAGDHGLTVEAAGYDASMKALVSADVAEPGKVLVPGRFLHQLAGALSGVIELTASGDTLHLVCGRSNYDLPLFPTMEYVRSVYDDVEILGEVDAHDFKTGLGMVAHAVDPRTALNQLKGIHLVASKEDSRLTMEATDRYMLASTFMDWTGDSFESLPDGGHLADVIKGLHNRLKLGVTAGRLMIADANRSAILASYSEQYPNVANMLAETDRAYEVTFNRDEILAALKRLGQVRETKMTPVWLDISADGVCSIELAGGESRRSGMEQVDCETTTAVALSFNPAYLAETIAAHAVDKVTLSGKAMGVRVPPRVSGDPRLSTVLMQIRLPGSKD